MAAYRWLGRTTGPQFEPQLGVQSPLPLSISEGMSIVQGPYPNGHSLVDTAGLVEVVIVGLKRCTLQKKVEGSWFL